MKITISSKVNLTKEQIETALLARGIKTENFKQFKAVRIIGDALDTTSGKGLHAAVFSSARRELVVNAYPIDGSAYIVIRLTI